MKEEIIPAIHLVLNLASVPGRTAVGQFPNCTKPQTLAVIVEGHHEEKRI